jgi:uncharacterized membrane protein
MEIIWRKNKKINGIKMDKKQFLNELKGNIKGISKEDKEEIIRDYEEHFAIGKKKGRKEADIAKGLGNPRQLAKQARMELLVSKAEEEKSAGNILRLIFATLSLSLFNLIFVVGIFFGLFAVVVSLFAVGFAIALSGLALVIFAFFPAIELFYIPAFNHVAVFFGGIAIMSLGGLFTIGAYYVGKGFYIITVKYVKLNIRIIKGNRK